MADRTLGDIPGLSDLLPGTTSILPSDYSVMEVDNTGAVTADQLGIGDITHGMTPSGDPFAPTPGWLDQQEADQQATARSAAVSDPMASSYMPTVDENGVVVGGSAVGDFTDEQVSNARIISEVGQSLGASSRDIQIALMTAIVESGLRNLDFGDRDSVGMFQQRDAWGSREDRLDPAKAATMFFKGGAGGQRGLLDVKDRDKMTPGEAAQAVQVSAFPDRYAEHEAEAAQLLGAIAGGEVTHGNYAGKNPYDLTEYDGKTVDNLTAAALDAAAGAFGAGFRVMQGSHNVGGVAASGGTHDGGGVVDIAPENGDWEGAVAALRKIGFAAWIRNAPGHGSAGEGTHIHAVLIGDKQLSPQALVQVQSYLHNDNGLAGSAPDDGPRQYVNNRFVWGEAPRKGPSLGEKVVKDAQTFLGAPFKWGGEDYDGVDGLGLVRAVYSKLGADVPRDLGDMVKLAAPVSIEEAKRGDVVGWDAHPELGGSHAGIYLGNGLVLEAGGPGRVVQVSSLDSMPGAFSIPIGSLTQRSPAVEPVRTTQIVPGTTSVVEPHASIPSARPEKPRHKGVFSGGTTFDQKPHGPA